jgi:osmotically-inducible protein OsmY
MKKACTILGLGLVSILSTDLYSSCPGGNCGYQGQGYYQGQPQGQYYQGQYYQGQPQGQYYQGHEQSQGQYYQDKNQGYTQDQYRQSQYYHGNDPRNQRNIQVQVDQYPRDNDLRNQGSRDQYQRDQYQRDNDQRHQGSRDQFQRDNDLRNQGSRDQYQRPMDQDRDSRDSRNVSEREIAKEVHDLLESGVFSSGYPNVTFSVDNGNVTLKGTVDTLDDKNKIEDKVRKIKGVRQIKNQITLAGKQTSYNDSSTYNESSRTMHDSARTTDTRLRDDDSSLKDHETKIHEAAKHYPQDSATTPADKLLNARIRESVSDGWFSRSYETITFRTNNGVVTVIGAVDSNDDVKKIADKLRDIDGIKSVNNQLTIKNRH